MQYGKVLNLRFYNNTIQFIVKNRLLIILFLFFIISFSTAVFTFGKYTFLKEWVTDYIIGFITEREGFTFFRIAVDSFLSSMLFIVLCLICGTSMLGVILTPLIIVFKGYFYGSITAYLYSAYSFEGVAFNAVILLSPAIITTVVLIFSSIEAIGFSCKLAKLTFSYNTTFDLNFEFRNYCIKFLMFSFYILVSGFIDAVLSVNFLKNFSGIT